MSVTFKGWSREGNHFHHTIVTWVNVSPEMAFAYAADITRHSEWSFDEIKVAPLTSRHPDLSLPQLAARSIHRLMTLIDMNFCSCLKTAELRLKFSGQIRRHRICHLGCLF